MVFAQQTRRRAQSGHAPEIIPVIIVVRAKVFGAETGGEQTGDGAEPSAFAYRRIQCAPRSMIIQPFSGNWLARQRCNDQESRAPARWSPTRLPASGSIRPEAGHAERGPARGASVLAPRRDQRIQDERRIAIPETSVRVGAGNTSPGAEDHCADRRVDKALQLARREFAGARISSTHQATRAAGRTKVLADSLT